MRSSEQSPATSYFKTAPGIRKKPSEPEGKRPPSLQQQMPNVRPAPPSVLASVAEAKKKALMNTWTPNMPHDASPQASPGYKYKHFSLLNQFNKSPTNKAAFKTTTSFGESSAGQELSSQFLAIKNNANSVNLSGSTRQTGFRPAPRTAAMA